MKKINIFILINSVFALLFSIINICFAADVSCLAFLLCAAYSAVIVFFTVFQFAKNKEYKKLFLCRKLLQYEAFVFLIAFIIRRAGLKGTSYGFDVLSVLCWLAVFITSNILSYWFDFKRFKKHTGIDIPVVKNESVGKMFATGKTRSGAKVTPLSYLKWFCFEVVDWADALLQAVFLVLLFQIFFFQFYKIPSESMVPEYMINDRVAVSKITSGPKFPLTDVGFPCMKDYKRGDIVVFRNPHYTIDRQSEVKSVVSQLIYMFTFTFVNTNVDEQGKLKADPLVKRITGVPGEQLMMQDGVLYSRTKDSKDFKPVAEDATWAVYNQNTEPEGVKRMIQEFPISTEIFSQFEAFEAYRNSVNLSKLEVECKNIAQEFAKLASKDGSEKPLSKEELYSIKLNNVSLNELYIDEMWNEYRNGSAELSMKFLSELFSSEYKVQFFNAFMTDWTKNYEDYYWDGYIGGNLYEESSFKFNIIYKYYIGSMILETYKNVLNDVPTHDWKSKENVQQFEANLHLLYYYLFFMDLRNMPAFPEDKCIDNGKERIYEPQYIPENCFFMMGDNRFNSLDMRHSETAKIRPLSKYDDASLTYSSHINPQYVPKKLILGTTGIRFWPISRPERASKTSK